MLALTSSQNTYVSLHLCEYTNDNRIRASPCETMDTGMYVEIENGNVKKIRCLRLKFPFTV